MPVFLAPQLSYYVNWTRNSWRNLTQRSGLSAPGRLQSKGEPQSAHILNQLFWYSWFQRQPNWVDNHSNQSGLRCKQKETCLDSTSVDVCGICHPGLSEFDEQRRCKRSWRSISAVGSVRDSKKHTNWHNSSVRDYLEGSRWCLRHLFIVV